MAQKVWQGSEVTVCDLCDGSFHDKKFVDGKTDQGPWAVMCTGCHVTHGCGLGTGKGQQYQLDTKTLLWVKIAG